MKTILFLLSGSVLLLLPTTEDIPHVKGETVLVAARDSSMTSAIDMFDIDSSFLFESSTIKSKRK
jgi:hypothetical protein